MAERCAGRPPVLISAILAGLALWLGPPGRYSCLAAAAGFFDPRECSQQQGAGVNAGERWAFVFAHDLHAPPNLTELGEGLRLLRHFHPSERVVFLHPSGAQLPGDLARALERFKVSAVARAFPQLPAALRAWGDVRRNCCSWREYLKLAAWTLVEYSAVVLLDTDQLVLGDLGAAFRCAEQRLGRLLYTSGPLSPLNAGFLAFRPCQQIYQDMQRLLLQVQFHPRTGFDERGFGLRGWFRDELVPPHPPPQPPYPMHYGAEGPQGFLYHYFVQRQGNGPAGIPGGVAAVELDRCVWNYQKEGLAKGAFPCAGYSQRPLLVHKADSRARRHVADVKRREGVG